MNKRIFYVALGLATISFFGCEKDDLLEPSFMERSGSTQIDYYKGSSKFQELLVDTFKDGLIYLPKSETNK